MASKMNGKLGIGYFEEFGIIEGEKILERLLC
jgi:hypothetical protein